MKRLIKILSIVIITAISLSFIFSVSAFALSSESTDTVEGAHYTDTEKAADESILEELISALEKYAAEILSALTFIASIVIMLCYKKGLLPLFNDGLKALKSGVKTINEKSESFNEHAIAICDGIDKRLERAEAAVDTVLKSTDVIEKRLAELQSEGKDRERLSIILSSQIDMLYEIFMSAALPQYLKDSVGEKIALMKAAIGKEEKNEELV